MYKFRPLSFIKYMPTSNRHNFLIYKHFLDFSYRGSHQSQLTHLHQIIVSNRNLSFTHCFWNLTMSRRRAGLEILEYKILCIHLHRLCQKIRDGFEKKLRKFIISLIIGSENLIYVHILNAYLKSIFKAKLRFWLDSL